MKEPYRDGNRFVHPRYRQFTVTSGDAQAMVYSGIDATPASVIEQRRFMFEQEWKANEAKPYAEKMAPLTFMGWWGDEILWEGNTALALLELRMEGPRLVMDVHKLPALVWEDDFDKGPDDGDEGDDRPVTAAPKAPTARAPKAPKRKAGKGGVR